MLPGQNHGEVAEAIESIAERQASLTEILALVRTDSAQKPAEYLEETVVPHGGE